MARSIKRDSLDDGEPEGDRCKLNDNIIIGTVESVLIGKKEYLARIDTGAKRSGICESLVNELKLGPPIKRVSVGSANGVSVRDVIEVDFVLAGKKIRSTFTVSNRGHMKFDVLIGRNALKRGFLIDPSR